MIRIALAIVLAFSTPTIAEPYKVLRVLDGDTVEIEAKFLPKELKQTLLLRISGIDSPEIGGKAKCPNENKLAQEAKSFVITEINKAKVVDIKLIKWDKYGGRIVGDVYVDGILLSKKLIAMKLAVSYDGKKKPDWCNK
jgi:endonuclease YncB( thermonuclease family)